MEVNIVKVNGIFWSGKADAVTAPGIDGEVTILPNHIPLVTTLRNGRIVIKNGAKEEFTHDVDHGVLEVTGKRVTVLL